MTPEPRCFLRKSRPVKKDAAEPKWAVPQVSVPLPKGLATPEYHAAANNMGDRRFARQVPPSGKKRAETCSGICK